MNYYFNNIQVDCENYRLITRGKETQVEPQVFNLIVYLLENRSKIVSRKELLNKIWNNKVVSNNTINNCIKLARGVLSDDGHKQTVIKTIHSRGYKFVASMDNAPQEQARLRLVLLTLILITILAISKIGVPQKISFNNAFQVLSEWQPNSDQLSNISFEQSSENTKFTVFDESESYKLIDTFYAENSGLPLEELSHEQK